MIKQEEKIFTESLYDEFSFSIKAMAKFILKSDKLADKALVRTFRKIIKFRKIFYRVEKADVRRIVVVFLRSICFGILRKERKLNYDKSFSVPEVVLNESAEKGDNMLSDLLKKDNLRWFKDTFVSFGSPFKEICIMKFYYNMETSEVANILGLKKAQVNSVLGKRLARLKSETDHFLGGKILPAEMGVALGLVSKQYVDEEIKRLESFEVSRVKVLPETKEKLLKYLDFCQKKPLIYTIASLVALVLIAVAVLIIVL